MEKKPLEALISVSGLWMSRAGVLHKIEYNEASARKIYIETVCGDRFVVNNSRNSRTARAFRHQKYRKTCKHCKISDEEIANFLTNVNDNKNQVKVEAVPTTQAFSAPQLKKTQLKSASKTPGHSENQLTYSLISAASPASSPALSSASLCVSSSAQSIGTSAAKLSVLSLF